MLEFYEIIGATQLLAMEISKKLNNDVEMPRNLAKSVIVKEKVYTRDIFQSDS